MIFGDPPALVAFARAHSPYFAGLYRELPVAPRWSQIPVVDPEHYWASKAADFDATLSGPADAGSWLWTTGGSTSRSKYVAVSREDFCEEVRAFSPAFERAGLVAGDRVANLTWAGELSASFILTGAILEGLPVQQLPILGMGDPARILALCRELRPTALLTFPMVATRLAELLRARDEVLPVAKILYAGEPLHDDQRALLRERFACAHLACFGYGAVDCGPIAAADPERADQKTVLRPLPGYALVEILDDDDRPCALGEPGRVTITNLGRRLSPVIRFPVGDLGHWIEQPALDAAGCPTVGGAFVLDGRAHLSVKLGFWIVAHADVAAEVAALGVFHSPVQLLVRRVDGVKTLVVRVAPLRDNVGGDVGAALVELRERLRRRYPKLGDPPGGPMSPVLRVEACALGAMTLSAAGKIRPIISEETTP